MPRYIDADSFIGWVRTRYCKDCDKRKGMKNGKMRFVYDIGNAPCRSCDVDDMVEDVDNFPAADVAEVRHGHWKTGLNKQANMVCTECSECGFPFGYHGFKFCPNCRAEMLGKESNE